MDALIEETGAMYVFDRGYIILITRNLTVIVIMAFSLLLSCPKKNAVTREFESFALPE
jgi:hypothetical protein